MIMKIIYWTCSFLSYRFSQIAYLILSSKAEKLLLKKGSFSDMTFRMILSQKA